MSENITFVTHLRYDHDDRIQNLQIIVDYYSKNFPSSKFIFIEDDKEHNKKFDTIKWHKKTSFYFIENKGVYHRTHALNYGFKQAKTPIVVSLDTDCIVDSQSIKKCEEALLENCTAAWPYNGYFLDIDFNLKNKFLDSNMDYNILLNDLKQNYQPKLGTHFENFYVRCTNDINNHLGVGGIVMFNKERFSKIGGYNQNYIGWGCEDNDVKIRLKTLNCDIFRDNNEKSICFHLFHRSASRAENPFYEKNFDIVRKVEAMSEKELKEYINSWNSFK